MKFDTGPAVPLTQMPMDSYSSDYLKQNNLQKSVNYQVVNKVLRTTVSVFEYSVWRAQHGQHIYTDCTEHKEHFHPWSVFLKTAPYIIKCNMAMTLLQSQHRDSHAYWLKPDSNQEKAYKSQINKCFLYHMQE